MIPWVPNISNQRQAFKSVCVVCVCARGAAAGGGGGAHSRSPPRRGTRGAPPSRSSCRQTRSPPKTYTWRGHDSRFSPRAVSAIPGRNLFFSQGSRRPEQESGTAHIFQKTAKQGTKRVRKTPTFCACECLPRGGLHPACDPKDDFGNCDLGSKSSSPQRKTRVRVRIPIIPIGVHARMSWRDLRARSAPVTEQRAINDSTRLDLTHTRSRPRVSMSHVPCRPHVCSRRVRMYFIW